MQFILVNGAVNPFSSFYPELPFDPSGEIFHNASQILLKYVFEAGVPFASIPDLRAISHGVRWRILRITANPDELARKSALFVPGKDSGYSGQKMR